jgi:thiol-disulfide isomerase/thioredoxin
MLVLALSGVGAAQIAGPIRNKISAGDLASAESILEVHERDKGRDAHYLEGLTWVLRGAVLLGEWDKAARHDEQLRGLIEEKLKGISGSAISGELAAALGGQIESHAQILARQKSRKKQAVAYLDEQLARFAQPVGLRSRIYKRRNLLALEGEPAPDFSTEETLTPNAPTLGALRGKPVLVFGWAQWCADCKAQAHALGRIRAKFEPRGVQFVTLTRFYDADIAAERTAINKVWNETYSSLAGLPILISTRGMERYGVSSTPTFILIDAAGKVRRYIPYRLTEAELDKLLAPVSASSSR